MTVGQALFSFRGRMKRSDYWVKGVLVLLPIGLLNNYLAYGVGTDGALVASMVIGLISLWPGLAMMVKRLHDHDRSGWWAATLFIPIANIFFAIWLVVLVGFLRGTVGPNRYGEDPLPPAGRPDAVAPMGFEGPAPVGEVARAGGPARGGKWALVLSLATAWIAIVAVATAGWLYRRDISDHWFLFTQCDRVPDGVDGYARYRHTRAGATFAMIEGVLFEELGPNAQSYPEYRHVGSHIVFVQLPGGHVAPKGGGEPLAVGPFLIARSSVTSQQLARVLGPNAVGPNGSLPYADSWRFARLLGLRSPSPTLPQRYFALGGAWRPSTGTAVYPVDPSTPNEYGIVCTGPRCGGDVVPG
jgi:uncharacterized membrane protein YhaH (DUF805 family)